MRRVAVDQLLSSKIILRKELVGTSVDLLYGVVAFEGGQRFRININSDIVQCRWFAFHDRAAT